MIRVIKRDGGVEAFDRAKLAASIWGAMRSRHGCYLDAMELAKGVSVYIERMDWPTVCSAAVFEMTAKVLRRVYFTDSARAYEQAHQFRKSRRKQFRVVHGNGRVTMWDKSWLAKVACRSWQLSPGTARILAGHVEAQLLSGGGRWISRNDAIAVLNELVAQFGLADAVLVGGESSEL